MNPCFRQFSLILAAGVSVFASTGRAAVQISTESPFQPKGGAAVAAAPTENSPLELSGIIEEDGQTLFGLFDPVKRQGGWVKLNETGRDFVVKSYNGTDGVTVEYQGRVLNLVLKAARIESSGTQAAYVPPAVAQPGRPPVAVGQTPADEARRLESVAQEVRRRRAMRQAAAQQAPNAQPQGAPPPQAVPAPQGR